MVRPMSEKMSLRACLDAAARPFKGEKLPGIMGPRLTSAVTTHVGCAMHSPNDHFHPIAFDGRDCREEWLKAYETVDPNNGPANPLTAQDVYLVRLGNCEPSKATFRPLEGAVTMYVHSGAAHLMVGHSADGTRPPFTARVVLSRGSRFELVQPGTWWALAPIGSAVVTIVGMRPVYDKTVDDVRGLPPVAIKNIAITTLET